MYLLPERWRGKSVICAADGWLWETGLQQTADVRPVYSQPETIGSENTTAKTPC